MRWENGRRSENVEDRRGKRVSPTFAGGGVGAMVIVLIAMYFGIDPTIILQQMGVGGSNTESSSHKPVTFSPEENALADFVAVVLGDTEDTWQALFKSADHTYQILSWCCFLARYNPLVVSLKQRLDRFIARLIIKSILI